MFSPKGQKLFLSFLLSKYTLAVSLIILIFWGSALTKGIIKKKQVDREISKLEKEINAMEQTNGELKGLIDYLKTEDYFESEARLKLGFKKEGEDVAVIPGTEVKYNFLSSQKDGNEEIPNYIKWKNHFWPNPNI